MLKIVGNYELTLKLGSGSYAQVYKCMHSKTKDVYAIKAISKEKVGDTKLMENLEQEISIMRDYLHPNIVQLFEHFSSSRYIYLVLEICPGGDLSKFIKKCHRVEERVAQGFLRQLSDGLHFLQQKNVIHRDLKPANILLSEFSTQAVLKIADFGFAKHLVEASMAQTPCGSPLYMAPEIFDMQEYDAKADIWSVGCVFYEMLVGTPPFKGANPRELFQNIRTKSLQIPSEVKVGPESLALLKKLLERNPQRRASMDQFCAACSFLPVTCSVSPSPSPDVDNRGGVNPFPVVDNRGGGTSHSADVTTSVSVNPADGANPASTCTNAGSAYTNTVNPVGITVNAGMLNPTSSVASTGATTIVTSAKVDSKSGALSGSKLGRAETSAVNEQHCPGQQQSPRQQYSPNNTPPDTQKYSKNNNLIYNTPPDAPKYSKNNNLESNQSQYASSPRQQCSPNGTPLCSPHDAPLDSHKHSNGSTQKHSDSSAQDSNPSPQYTQSATPHPHTQSQSAKQGNITHLGDPLSRRHSTDSIQKTGKQMVPSIPMNNSNMNNNQLNYNHNTNNFDLPRKSMSMNDRSTSASTTCHSTSQSLENEGVGGGGTRSAEKSSPRLQTQHQQPSMTSSLFGIGISKAIAFVMNSPSKTPPTSSPHTYTSPSPRTHAPPATPSPPTMRLPPSEDKKCLKVQNAYGPSHGVSPSLDEKRTRAYSLSEAESGKPRLSTNQHPYGQSTSSKSTKTLINVSQSQISSPRRIESIDGYHNSERDPMGQWREQGGGRLPVVNEEKKTIKGVNLSESDDGFVFVDSTPLTSPLHPWRNSTSANAANALSASNMKSKKNEKNEKITNYSVKISDNNYNENEKSNQKNDEFQYDSNLEQLDQQNYAPNNQQHFNYKLNINPSLLYENEKNEKMIRSAVIQRCEYVCEIVLAIVSIGDMMAKDSLLHEKRSTTPIALGVGAGSKGGIKGKAGRFLRPRGDSFDGPLASLTGACALHLHCLALLKDAIERTSLVTKSGKLNQSTSEASNQPPPQSLLKGHLQALLALFDQLVGRVDQGYKKLAAALPTGSAKNSGKSGYNQNTSAPPSNISPPWGGVPGMGGELSGRITAEPLMYRAAIQLSRDASVEELLGNLQKACDNYSTARLLVLGVMMTTSEPSDCSTLQHFAQEFGEQYTHCHQLLESHTHYGSQ